MSEPILLRWQFLNRRSLPSPITRITETAVRRPRGEPGVQPVSGIKRRPHRGNRFWTRGYCVDTVGLDEAKIRAYAPALRVDSLLRAAR